MSEKLFRSLVLVGLAVSTCIVVGLIQHPQRSQAESETNTNAIASIRADHILLRVPNFEETKQWYEEKLGFREVTRWTDPGLPEIQLAYLERNGFRVEIVGGGTPKQAAAKPTRLEDHLQLQGYRHLCFQVNDVNDVLAELNRRGVLTFDVFDYPTLQRRLGFVLDNNSNMIEFSGPIKGKALR